MVLTCSYELHGDSGKGVMCLRGVKCVAYPIGQDECHLSKELLCGMGNGYYYTALGFNMQDARVSQATSNLSDMRVSNATKL